MWFYTGFTRLRVKLGLDLKKQLLDLLSFANKFNGLIRQRANIRLLPLNWIALQNNQYNGKYEH